MNKQLKKSNAKMSMFRRLTLGNMICNYIFIGLTIVLGVLFVITQLQKNKAVPSFKMILFGMLALCALALAAAAILAIAQEVEARHYGDIFGKLTKKNTTIILTVFYGFAFLMIVSALVLVIVRQQLVDDDPPLPENIAFMLKCIIIAIAGLGYLSIVGYTVTSTIAFKKSK